MEAGDSRFEAEHVVVAMASYQRRRVPSFARELDPGMVQLHSSDYRNLSQLRSGGVLIVGAGNSGAEIALETARGGHATWVSGRDTGSVPFRLDSLAGRAAGALRVPGVVPPDSDHRAHPSAGRRARQIVSKGAPLIRMKQKDWPPSGVQRVPRTTGVEHGRPVLEDGRVLDVENVIWCTGFHPGFSWIDLPIFGEDGEPDAPARHRPRPAGTLLRRPAFPLRAVVDDDPRGGEGRRARGQGDCGPEPGRAGGVAGLRLRW